MQTGLSFCDKSNSCLSGVSIWNETAMNSRSAHFSLLCAFPAIGVAENKLKVFLNGAPQGRAIGMCVSDEIFCTLEEITEVIAKDLYGRFSLWKWRKAHSVHFKFHCLRAQSKLESRPALLALRMIRTMSRIHTTLPLSSRSPLRHPRWRCPRLQHRRLSLYPLGRNT